MRITRERVILISSDIFKKMLEPVLGGDSKFLAAVTAAGCKNPASVRSAHSLAKAVLVDSLAIGRLECSFHICFLYIFGKWTAKVSLFFLIPKFFLILFQGTVSNLAFWLWERLSSESSRQQ